MTPETVHSCLVNSGVPRAHSDSYARNAAVISINTRGAGKRWREFYQASAIPRVRDGGWKSWAEWAEEGEEEEDGREAALLVYCILVLDIRGN